VERLFRRVLYDLRLAENRAPMVCALQTTGLHPEVFKHDDDAPIAGLVRRVLNPPSIRD